MIENVRRERERERERERVNEDVYNDDSHVCKLICRCYTWLDMNQGSEREARESLRE